MTQPLGSCPGCSGDEPFEQVHPGMRAGEQCPDADGECPEWVCPGCGTGVFMGTVIIGTYAADVAPAPARQSVRAA
jgi:hypothetical protein